MTRRARLTHPITVLNDDHTVLWSGDPVTDYSWQRHAHCGPGDADIYFPSQRSSAKDAKAQCARCPVRFACIENGIGLGDTDGVRGGLSASGKVFSRLASQRMALARRLAQEAP